MSTSEVELQLMRAYLRGFGDRPEEWSPEKHLAGLKEVFRAGADAARRQNVAGGEGA